jgi:hypothetical protein
MADEPTTMPVEMVERAARALYNDSASTSGTENWWPLARPDDQDVYRRAARVVLSAALQGDDAEARGYQRAIDDLLAVPSHETHVAADWLEARRAGRGATFTPAEPDYVWGVRYRSSLLADHIILADDEAQARRKVRFHRGQATATVVRAPRGEWEEAPDA